MKATHAKPSSPHENARSGFATRRRGAANFEAKCNSDTWWCHAQFVHAKHESHILSVFWVQETGRCAYVHIINLLKVAWSK